MSQRVSRRFRRFHSADEESFSSTSIFITPMLDMSFQLLAFFVVTYNPSALEAQFPITLAEGEAAGNAAVTAPQDKAALRQPTELKPSVIIEARANAAGRVVGLRVIVSGQAAEIPTENGPEAMYAALRSRLMAIKAQNPAEDQCILRGTRTLLWSESIRILDICRNYDSGGERRDLFPRVQMDLLQ